MLRRARLRAIPRGFVNFRGRKILRSKSRAIAPKFMPPGGAQLAQDLQRSLSSVVSVGMLRRVRLRVISSGFRTENFEFFSATEKLTQSSQSPRDRAKIRAVAALRPDEVLSNCAEGRHAAEREIACDSRGFLTEIFEKISRPRNVAIEIARDRTEIRCYTVPVYIPYYSG